MSSPERPHAWEAPAENVVPGPVYEDIILARGDDVAVWLSDIAATPEGVRLRLNGLAREAVADDGPLVLEVAFADGRGARLTHGDPEPADVVLHAMAGTSGSRRDLREVWLWPLPPDGPVTFTARWPAAGLEDVVATVDAAVLRDAAARAEVLWDDERPQGWRRSTSYGGRAPRPDHVLPAVVPVEVQLGRGRDWAVWVERVAFDADGVRTFTVDVAARAELPETSPRVAVGGREPDLVDAARTGRRARFGFRAAGGPETVSFAWPEAGIGPLTAELAGAARGEELWPAAPRPGGGGWLRYAS